jgi:hypothetical protein
MQKGELFNNRYGEVLAAINSEPTLINVAEATKAIQWLEEFMHGDSPDAAQARVVCGLIRGLERVARLAMVEK